MFEILINLDEGKINLNKQKFGQHALLLINYCIYEYIRFELCAYHCGSRK
jgi:hypothetical protein